MSLKINKEFKDEIVASFIRTLLFSEYLEKEYEYECFSFLPRQSFALNMSSSFVDFHSTQFLSLRMMQQRNLPKFSTIVCFSFLLKTRSFVFYHQLLQTYICLYPVVSYACDFDFRCKHFLDLLLSHGTSSFT